MQKWIASCKQFINGMNDCRLFVYATSGSYYIFMALVPTVMVVLCILPYTPFTEDLVLSYISMYFSKDLAEIMSDIASAIYDANAATLTISIVLTLVSASSAMRALMRGMDSAYSVETHQNLIIQCFRAMGYMVLLIAGLLANLVILVYGGEFVGILKQHLPGLPQNAFFSLIASQNRYFVILLILFFYFMLIYKIMPSKKLKYFQQYRGALFCSICWVSFSYVFNLYITNSDKFGAYGVIGTVMVAMMWINYCFLFLLIGGYINNYFSKE